LIVKDFFKEIPLRYGVNAMSKKHYFSCALLVLLVIGLFPFVVTADSEWLSEPTSGIYDPLIHSVLDQSQTSSNGGGYFWAERFFGQTFTPGLSAQLAHVELKIDTWIGQPSMPATISIVNTKIGRASCRERVSNFV
jgi:hypothetical protein